MTQSTQLSNFYKHVQTTGQLRTPAHAERWTRAVLQTLGMQLPRRIKRTLAKALPEDLADDLTSIFWLLHFRNHNMPLLEFQTRVGLRAGNTDKQFAYYPTVAVFAGLHKLINADIARQVADALSPELHDAWQQASQS
jgi:uncharacterized protein (DUF2267 family)